MCLRCSPTIYCRVSCGSNLPEYRSLLEIVRLEIRARNHVYWRTGWKVLILILGFLSLICCDHRILESKDKDFPVGKYVVGSFGWRDYTVASNKPVHYLGFPAPRIVEKHSDLPLSLYLGVLGMPGYYPLPCKYKTISE